LLKILNLLENQLAEIVMIFMTMTFWSGHSTFEMPKFFDSENTDLIKKRCQICGKFGVTRLFVITKNNELKKQPTCRACIEASKDFLFDLEI